MKKVLIISNMYPSKDHLSYGIFVKNQVEQLQAHGTDTLLAVNDNPATGKKNVLKKYAKWAIDVWRTFRQNKQDIALTHAHYIFPSGLFSYYLKKRHNIPYVVTSHGGDINKMPKKSPRIRKYTSKILQNADHVIAVGEELAQAIERDYGVQKEKLSVMSMGIDRSIFHEVNKKEMQQALQMDSTRTNFLFVGNIIEEKGLLELITAFQQLDEAKAALYCIGSTKDAAFSAKVQALVKSAHIHFIQPMPQRELVRYFQAADAFVLPSHIEGLGLVALEAMACGTPVIASNVGGLKYMLQDGAGVLVPAKDTQALQQAMAQALSGLKVDKTQCEKLLQTHDAAHITTRLLQIYTHIAKKDG